MESPENSERHIPSAAGPGQLIRLVTLITAVLVSAGIAALVLLEWDAVRERDSLAHIETEFQDALPAGTPETTIDAYLESRRLPHSTSIVSQQASRIATVYVEGRVSAGTRVITAELRQDGSLIWLSTREITIIFVLDDSRLLERILIYAYDRPLL